MTRPQPLSYIPHGLLHDPEWRLKHDPEIMRTLGGTPLRRDVLRARVLTSILSISRLFSTSCPKVGLESLSADAFGDLSGSGAVGSARDSARPVELSRQARPIPLAAPSRGRCAC